MAQASTMASQQVVDELVARIVALEQHAKEIALPDPRGAGYSNRNIAQVLIAMESYVVTLKDDPPIQKSNLSELIDEKLKTALAMSKGNDSQQSWYNKSVLESKAIQDIGTVVDSRQCRQWNKKMKNAIEQIRPQSRHVVDFIEK